MSITIELLPKMSEESKIKVSSFFDADFLVSDCTHLPLDNGNLKSSEFDQNVFIIPEDLKLKSKSDDGTCILEATLLAKSDLVEKEAKDSVEFELINRKYLLKWDKEQFIEGDSIGKAHFLDQDFISSETLTFAFYAIGLVLLICLFFVLRFVKKLLKMRREKRELFAKREHWENIFLKDLTRIDFEEIYFHRKTWLELLTKLDLFSKYGKQLNHFFLTLNLYQYKKEWAEEDFIAVKESFLPIKNIFLRKEGKV